MKTISLTIPLEINALTRASDMLHGLALDLSKEPPVTKAVVEAGTGVVTEAPAPVPAATTEPVASEVFAVEATATTEPAAPNADPVASATESFQPAGAAGVEVDNDGLPWDCRIHALGAGGTHNKLKKSRQWKKKRGVDAALVAEVEAELRVAMSAGPANPVITEPSPAGAGAAVELLTAAVEAAVQPTSPAPAPAGGTTTFPALMAAITANGIDQVAVTAAVNAQGLQALPLLAARPDLIPAVAAALGV